MKLVGNLDDDEVDDVEWVMLRRGHRRDRYRRFPDCRCCLLPIEVDSK